MDNFRDMKSEMNEKQKERNERERKNQFERIVSHNKLQICALFADNVYIKAY